MPLTDLFAPIKLVHVALVAISGTLFALRGAAALDGQAWPLTRAWRLSSVVIDTALLSAGVTLWSLLELQPLRDTWLATKLALLVVYIVLGSFALERARTLRGRAWAYAAALSCYLFMASVALAHHPLGVLHAWFD